MPTLVQTVGLLDRLITLTAMDCHFLGSVDPQPHFVAPYFDYGDDDIVTNDDAFVFLAEAGAVRKLQVNAIMHSNLSGGSLIEIQSPELVDGLQVVVG